MITVNGMYRSFSRGELDRESFLAVCCLYVEQAAVQLFRVSRTEREDTVSEFYPRLCRIVRRYEDNGSSFEAYLTVSLRYFCRGRLMRLRRLQMRELLQGDISDSLMVAETPDYTAALEANGRPGFFPATAGFITDSRERDTVRRHLLICFCKNFPLLDDGEIRMYMKYLEIPLILVESLQAYTTDRRQRYIRRRNDYITQRDRHFARMHSLHHMARQEYSPERKTALMKKSESHRRIWQYYRDRLKRQNVHLSNREVGDLLGIPKGSVDSAMANLSRRLEKLGAAE
jgi:DNA-directed RNA polymerase specialized sigma24 family protein